MARTSSRPRQRRRRSPSLGSWASGLLCWISAGTYSVRPTPDNVKRLTRHGAPGHWPGRSEYLGPRALALRSAVELELLEVAPVQYALDAVPVPSGVAVREDAEVVHAVEPVVGELAHVPRTRDVELVDILLRLPLRL